MTGWQCFAMAGLQGATGWSPEMWPAMMEKKSEGLQSLANFKKWKLTPLSSLTRKRSSQSLQKSWGSLSLAQGVKRLLGSLVSYYEQRWTVLGSSPTNQSTILVLKTSGWLEKQQKPDQRSCLLVSQILANIHCSDKVATEVAIINLLSTNSPMQLRFVRKLSQKLVP